MIITTIRFTHYGPKDSKSGIMEYVVSRDEQQLIDYINKEYFYEDMFKDKDDNITVYGLSDNDKELAIKWFLLGKLDDFGDLVCKESEYLRVFKNNEYEDVDDAYYGVTNYNWRDQKNITQEQLDVLSLFVPLNVLGDSHA